MHIKSLTIQGFKTYRDAVIIDPLSENVNVVVGRNGAGKSNFFSAIRFVLSDAYTSLSRAERQALLHEGSSTAATFSAYVEIVFDNSDGRIPTGKNEVILRRTIGAKKDDYSLDRKSTSKAEVMSLLESAGFSKSNPFFIVPQGRITSLTNQKDSERLELLKEIAGTRVYEDRKQESLKIMAETEQKQVKIDELLTFIDERLTELEEEKKELKEFQVADKERRCTEYCIYQHDLEEAKEALDEIDDERLNEQRQADDMRRVSGEREAQLAEAEAYITEQKEQLELVTLEKQQLEADKNESIKAQTQLELLIRDLEDTTERNASERQGLQSDLEELEKKILAKQRTLDESAPKYQDLLAKEADLRSKIEETEARQQSLLAKQGRAAQFRTQAKRDRYLRSHIQSSEATLETRQKIFDETSRDIEDIKASLEQGTKEEAEMRKTLETRRADAKTLTTQLADLNAQRQTLVEQQKEGWKDDEKLTKTVSHAKEELKKAEQSLSMTMDQATRKGLAAVREVVSRLRLNGVYGPLYELFEVNESFRTAVENIANTSLFHVVVDTDETASRILDVMVREQLGRVTFMPLNRLKPAQVRYPEQEEEAVPMISRLKFDERFRPAMSQVFGKAIIVPDLHMGAAYARSHGLTAITLQGDKQDKKGALTGGFHDSRRSRLESVKTVKHWEDKLRADRAKHNETKQAERRLQQEISELSGKIQIVERKLNQAKDARDPLNAEISAVHVEIEQNKARLESLQRELEDIQTHISHLNIQIETQEDELKTPMTDALSEEEAETLNRLAIEMQKHKKELNETSKDRQAMASVRSSLEIELGQNLVRKRDKIKEKLDSMADIGGDGPTQVETALAKHTASLESLQRTIETIVEKVQAVDKDSEKVKSAITSKEKESEALQAKQTEDSRGFSKQQKNVERYLAKRQILIVRKDECSKKIRELGALPPEAFERQKQKIQIKKLYKDLHSANEKLKKFGTVNKRAFDQFNEFTTQREELDTRRDELTKSEESIRELVDHLDMRKDEAIERTFKQVSKNFIEVFETLVPTGRGRLIMQKQLDQDDSDEDEGEEVVEEEEEDEGDEDEDEDEQGEEEDEDEDDMDVDEDEPTSKRHSKVPAKGKTSGKGKASSKSSKGKWRKSKKGSKAFKSAAAASKKKKKQQEQRQQKNKKKKKKGAIDAYTGISIKVSFNSKSDEGLRIQQLSGGQKSLVALAMIFAIQKCDPAPFYLFDEIDANLDADRRTAVANMIKSLSTSAQFIITTFRPELLTAADNFWGVMFDARKISTIKRITRDDAYTFIESASGPAPPQTGGGR